jgi:hypothetical protein
MRPSAFSLALGGVLLAAPAFAQTTASPEPAAPPSSSSTPPVTVEAAPTKTDEVAPKPPATTAAPEPEAVSPRSTKKSHGTRTGHHRAKRDKRMKPSFGGLGYAWGGLTMGKYGGMDDTLEAPTALGPGYGTSTGALMYGGGGGALIYGLLWIGGGGFGLSIPTSETAAGRSKLGGGGGGFDVGFAVVNRSNWLVIPRIGLGGMGLSMRVENFTSKDIKIGNEIVPASSSQRLETGFATGDIGISIMRLFMFGKHDGDGDDPPGAGGFMTGLQLGYMGALGRTPWSSDRLRESGLPSGDLGVFYARIVLGGGGFFYR